MNKHVFLIITIPLLFTGCAAPYRSVDDIKDAMAKHQPVNSDRLEVKANISCKPGATKFIFPSGSYIPTSVDNNNVYFMSPNGIQIIAIGGSYFDKGGFIISKSEGNSIIEPRFFVWSFDFPISDCKPTNAETLLRKSKK